MWRTLALGCWLLAVTLLPVAGVLTASSRAEGAACAEGACCCEAAGSASASAPASPSSAAGCCASGESQARLQLVAACACGVHGGAQHVVAAPVRLDLPSAGVALRTELALRCRLPHTAPAPNSFLSAPEPPPPRRSA